MVDARRGGAGLRDGRGLLRNERGGRERGEKYGEARSEQHKESLVGVYSLGTLVNDAALRQNREPYIKRTNCWRLCSWR